MDEREKWIDLARLDFSHNQFASWLNSSKAFNAFQNSTLPLDEDSYRAQVAIINALLVHHLDRHNKITNPKKIGHLILHLDKLILEATSLEASNSLRALNMLSRCLLYTRIGDFIVNLTHLEHPSNQSKSQEHMVLAIYSYYIAYEWAWRGWKGRQSADPLLAMCIMELHILIDKNLDMILEGRSAFDSCSLYLLHSFLSNFDKFGSPRQFEGSADSFMLMDQTTVGRGLYSLDLDVLMKEAWSLRRNKNFLRRIIWILSNQPSLGEDNYKFLDGLVHLPECPVDPEDACTPESLSLVDVKVLLFRLSRRSKGDDDALAGIFILPWLFHARPNSSQQLIWETISDLAAGQSNNIDQLDLQTSMQLANALEQIRAPDISTSTNAEELVETEKFIRRLKGSLTSKGRAFCENLISRYSEVIKSTATSECEWVLVVDETESVGKQIKMVQHPKEEEAELLLLDGHSQAHAERGLENVQTAEVGHGKASKSNSTQTDEPGPARYSPTAEDMQHADQDQRALRELEEVDFHIRRWIRQNETLKKLFMS